jgi:hypothetical protein
MDIEQLIQTLEKDRRLIRNMMKDQWPEFAARVAEVTARFAGITTNAELVEQGRQLFDICQEYDFVRQRLALAAESGQLVFRLPAPQSQTQRDLTSVANRFVAFGQSIAPKPGS